MLSPYAYVFFGWCSGLEDFVDVWMNEWMYLWLYGWIWRKENYCLFKLLNECQIDFFTLLGFILYLADFVWWMDGWFSISCIIIESNRCEDGEIIASRWRFKLLFLMNIFRGFQNITNLKLVLYYGDLNIYFGEF